MVKLRNFTVGDAEVLQQQQYYDMTVDAIRRMICDWNTVEYQDKYFEMFAVIADDKFVGDLSLYEHSDSVVSIGLDVFSEFQRRGIGKQAVISALPICKRKGYKIVCNQVRTDNALSIALHKSLGFETDHYIYKNQKGQDVYLFLKTLDEILM